MFYYDMAKFVVMTTYSRTSLFFAFKEIQEELFKGKKFTLSYVVL